MPNISLNDPSIGIDINGLITASVTQSQSGYLQSDTKTRTYQLSTAPAATITPGTSSKTVVTRAKYTTGDITVAGSANLVASNIKSGVNIFGVTGNLSSDTVVYWEPGTVTINGYNGYIDITFSGVSELKAALGFMVYCNGGTDFGISYIIGTGQYYGTTNDKMIAYIGGVQTYLLFDVNNISVSQNGRIRLSSNGYNFTGASVRSTEYNNTSFVYRK